METATSSLRASLLLQKPGTAQISPRLDLSFVPHGIPCSGISRGKQKKVAKHSRALEAARLKLENGSSMEHICCTCSPHRAQILLPHLSCSAYPTTTLQVS